MRDAPAEMNVQRTSGLAGRNKLRDVALAGTILRDFLNDGSGRAVIIAHLGDMVRTITQSTNWRARVNEGAVLDTWTGCLTRRSLKRQLQPRSPRARCYDGSHIDLCVRCISH
jgi:hypothetical protein